MRSNPFTYGNPISDPRRFFGRVREVDQIFGRLRNEEFESSSVVGDRRIGKTSLLNYLADPGVRAAHGLGPGRYNFVYVDLQMLYEAIGPVQLWRLLALMRRHCADNGISAVLAALERRERLDTFDLDELFQEVDDQGQHVVFLLDEFERVTENPNFGPDFYYGLRSLVIHHRVALTGVRLRSECVLACGVTPDLGGARRAWWSRIATDGSPGRWSRCVAAAGAAAWRVPGTREGRLRFPCDTPGRLRDKRV